MFKETVSKIDVNSIGYNSLSHLLYFTSTCLYCNSKIQKQLCSKNILNVVYVKSTRKHVIMNLNNVMILIKDNRGMKDVHFISQHALFSTKGGKCCTSRVELKTVVTIYEIRRQLLRLSVNG